MPSWSRQKRKHNPRWNCNCIIMISEVYLIYSMNLEGLIIHICIVQVNMAKMQTVNKIYKKERVLEQLDLFPLGFRLHVIFRIWIDGLDYSATVGVTARTTSLKSSPVARTIMHPFRVSPPGVQHSWTKNEERKFNNLCMTWHASHTFSRLILVLVR